MLHELVIEVASCGHGDAYAKVDVAAELRRLTGAPCAVALQLPWDAVEDYQHLRGYIQERGLRVGALGSPAEPAVEIAAELGATVHAVELGDGTVRPLSSDLELVVSHADWGIALVACQRLGPRARVCVDTGPRAAQIAAVLADADRLGGIRFDPRTYAPFELFVLFSELLPDRVPHVTIADSTDVEELVLAVVDLHEAYVKAALVDRCALREAREFGDVVGARQVLLEAFRTDVRPACAAARAALGAAEDPLMALRQRDLIR